MNLIVVVVKDKSVWVELSEKLLRVSARIFSQEVKLPHEERLHGIELVEVSRQQEILVIAKRAVFLDKLRINLIEW